MSLQVCFSVSSIFEEEEEYSVNISSSSLPSSSSSPLDTTTAASIGDMKIYLGSELLVPVVMLVESGIKERIYR